MEMVGVSRIRAWAKHGREPSAGRAPHRLHERRLFRICWAPDRDAPPVGEQDCDNVDRDSLAMGAGFRAHDLVSTPTFVARAGVERGDGRAKRRLAERRQQVAHESGEGERKLAIENRAARQTDRRAAAEAERRQANRRGDAAVGKRMRRRGHRFRLDIVRSELSETRASRASLRG
jgi:hypothetical protein